jgi:putative oxidoreductase
MKIVTLIARVLLGLVFVVFGFNKFVMFIPAGPMPVGAAGEFTKLLMSTHYIYVVGFFEVVGGLLVLVNRYVPLGLALLAPVMVNIVAFDVLMGAGGLSIGVVVWILWLLVAYRHRSAFAGLLQQQTSA